MEIKIKWKTEVKDAILTALEQNPLERFPNARSIWYYLWSGLGLIPGTESTYKKADALLVWMRKEGLIPFGRFRVERGKDGYGGALAIDPEYFIDTTIGDLLDLPQSYELPKLFGQPFLIELWVEKKGLIPTFEAICDRYDIKVRSPEGFTPWEFTYHAKNDMEAYFRNRKSNLIRILYFGDQDPSGEEIFETLKVQLDFFVVDHDTDRVGVTVEQISAYGLPETPFDQKTLEKIRRDSRYGRYIRKHGRDIFCELDSFISLAYDDFHRVVEEAIDRLIDDNAVREREELNHAIRQKLEETIEPDRVPIERIRQELIHRWQGQGSK